MGIPYITARAYPGPGQFPKSPSFCRDADSEAVALRPGQSGPRRRVDRGNYRPNPVPLPIYASNSAMSHTWSVRWQAYKSARFSKSFWRRFPGLRNEWWPVRRRLAKNLPVDQMDDRRPNIVRAFI